MIHDDEVDGIDPATGPIADDAGVATVVDVGVAPAAPTSVDATIGSAAGVTTDDASAADRHRVPRWMLAVVFAIGFGHAALYGVTFPPWAIEDEQQHVDYVWKIAFDHQVPTIEDEIDQAIVEGVFGADRFTAYDMATPEPTTEAMGLQARSYAAYHPPGVYLALAPAVSVLGERALVVLYALRLASVVAAGAVAVIAALLAADVARSVSGRHRVTVAASSADATGAVALLVRAGNAPTPSVAGVLAGRIHGPIVLATGLAVAALPVVAESGGRVNTDIYAALIVVIGCRLVLRWIDAPVAARSWALGIALAAAVLSRETAFVLAVPVIVAVAILLRSQRLAAGAVVRVFALPIVASVAWFGFQWQRSGYIDGSRSFLATYGDVVTLPAARPVTETIGDALLVPHGGWGVPWLVIVALVAVAAIGLGLLARAGGWVVAATAAGMVAFLAIAMVASMNRGLNVATARLLLPAYPAVIAAAVVGWATLRWRSATFVLTGAVIAFGAWFAVFELLVRFAPRLG